MINWQKKEEKYLKILYYKCKCIKKNQEIYQHLYTGNGITVSKYIRRNSSISGCLFDLYYKISNNENKNTNYDDGKITKAGYFKGKKLCGKAKVVDSVPDFRVQVVNSLPDLKVQKVENLPIYIGQWQFVDSLPDFKIQLVDCLPDFKIQFVDSFPGVA